MWILQEVSNLWATLKFLLADNDTDNTKADNIDNDTDIDNTDAAVIPTIITDLATLIFSLKKNRQANDKVMDWSALWVQCHVKHKQNKKQYH